MHGALKMMTAYFTEAVSTYAADISVTMLGYSTLLYTACRQWAQVFLGSLATLSSSKEPGATQSRFIDQMELIVYKYTPAEPGLA